MHSSRIHTARLLTVSDRDLPYLLVCVYVGVMPYLWTGSLPYLGVLPSNGIVGMQIPRVNRMAQTSENITFPILRMRAVNMVMLGWSEVFVPFVLRTALAWGGTSLRVILAPECLRLLGQLTRHQSVDLWQLRSLIWCPRFSSRSWYSMTRFGNNGYNEWIYIIFLIIL